MKIDKARWQQLEIHFDKLIELDADERNAYLHNLTVSDKYFVDDLRQLLAADDSALDSVLEKPLADFLDSLTTQFNGLYTEGAQLPLGNLRGTRINSYELKEEIGRGGMGVVYRAERIKGDFNQEVAIKILWHGSQELLLRFQREQQVLANLRHANIAQLFDGGVSDDGYSYLIMELVKGIPITDYATQNQLTLSARLKLIEQIIDALSYSHKNLIVHRDIKPSNILVTEEGEVKLLDFSIAKLLETASEKELTRADSHLLTPAYSAPEQVKNQSITVATDIYQLGLVLYLMLTGRAALNCYVDSLQEMVRIICESEPLKPSMAVLRQNEEVSSSLDVSQIKEFSHQLRGDLDAIILKMLRKVADERYSSMEALRSDLMAFYEKRPVLARQTSTVYSIQKFIQRRWQLIGVFVVGMLGISIYLATLTIQNEKIQTALKKSEIEQKKAEEVANFLIHLFKGADPNVGGLEGLSAKELLEQGRIQIDEQLKDSPEIKASLINVFGEIYQTQGEIENSYEMLVKAYQEQQSNERINDAVKMKTQFLLAVNLFLRNQLDEAIEFYFKIIEKGESNENLSNDIKLIVADAYSGIGLAYYRQGKTQLGIKYMKDAASKYRDLGDVAKVGLAQVLNNLAYDHQLMGRMDEAEKLTRESLSLLKDAYGERNSNYCRAAVNFGTLLFNMEKFDESKLVLEKVYNIQKEILGEAHLNSIDTLYVLGLLSHQLGEFKKSENKFLSYLLLASEIGDKRRMAQVYIKLASLMIDMGEYDSSVNYIEKARAILENEVSDSGLKARLLSEYARLNLLQNNFVSSTKLYQQAWEMMPDHPVFKSILALDFGYNEYLTGETDHANELLEYAERHFEKFYRENYSKMLLVKLLQLSINNHDDEDKSSAAEVRVALKKLPFPLPKQFKGLIGD